MKRLSAARYAVTCLRARDWPAARYAAWVAARGLDFSKVDHDELGFSDEVGAYHANGGGPRLHGVLHTLALDPHQTALDFGSGKGGALVTLAQYFDTVIGVELSEALIAVAHENLRRLGVRNVTMYAADATQFDALDQATVLHLFNPFPSTVMRVVLANVRRSLERRPRHLTVIYNNPVAAADLRRVGFTKQRSFAHPTDPPIDIYVS